MVEFPNLGDPLAATKVANGEPFGNDPSIELALDITKELFGCDEVHIEVMCEPEDESDRFVVFNVAFSGGAQEAVDKRLEWHRRIAPIEPASSGPYRISIH